MGIAVEFLPVGDSDGDAIIVFQWGEENAYWLNLTDAGYASVGEGVIAHVEEHYGRDVTIHNMVVSHADPDHAAGLISVFNRFKVGTLWMNRPWLYAQEMLDQFHGNWSLAGWINDVRANHEYLSWSLKIWPPRPPRHGASRGLPRRANRSQPRSGAIARAVHQAHSGSR